MITILNQLETRLNNNRPTTQVDVDLSSEQKKEINYEIDRATRYKHQLSIIMIDLDNFKTINDTYGHNCGDIVLKDIGHILANSKRKVDYVLRYGGEEFMGIFPETRLEEAKILANKIREHIKESKFHYEGDSVKVTVSAGLAQFEHEDTIKDVLKRADEALYLAKAQGRNRCVLG